VALVIGILLSPCLEPTSVWICLPLAILISFARPPFALLAVALVGAGLAGREPTIPPDPGDTAVRLIGRLTKAPEWHGLGTYLDVELQTVDGQRYPGRARLTEFLDDPELRRLFDALELGTGDRLEIVVKLHRPAVYRNPGVFDYQRHLERQGVYWTGTIRNPRLITVLDRGWHRQDRIKNWIQTRLEAPFSTDRNGQAIRGLVMGMVLGRKYGLTAETERQFQVGGLYHLVVVSGFNLAVVAGMALWVARRILWKRQTRLLFVLVCAMAYTAIVEGQAPVFRAALMVSFLVVGKLLDRGYVVLNASAGAAFIILLIDPSAIEDSSFQMTFAAVLAVVGIGVPASQWALGWLREALTDFKDASKDGDVSIRAADWRLSRRVWCELHGLPAWIVTLPWKVVLIAGEAAIVSVCVEMIFLIFMVESFHRLSPVSPLLNIPAGMITAAITPLGLLLIFLPRPAAEVVAWVITQLLGILLKILDVALTLPGATLRVPSAPLWVWVLYGVSILLLTAAIRKKWKRVCLGGGGAVVLVQSLIALGDFSPTPPANVTLTFLDVGQGDSALIEFPSGQRMLIDGGGISAGRFLNLRDESTFSIGENVVSAYLFSRGIRRLDTVVLTHAHHDHMDGLFDVIENFQIGEFWLGRNPMIPRYRELIKRINGKHIPIRWVWKGQTIGPFTVLHPPADWIPRKNAENDDSVVLLLNTGRATALLTGDIEREIPVPEKVDVLKVPHHGSKGVRVKVSATVRVISVGANNPFGHPHESALPALRTDRLGAITVTLANDQQKVSGALTNACRSCKLTLLFWKPLH
jgi:competence protein ComEC